MDKSSHYYTVSYLIALYNKEKYILECINSIIAEADHNINIEICIVDDGSTDNSLKTIKEQYSNKSNVKIESFKSNKGKNAAYNKAFTMSTGEYICIFGADDIVYPMRTTTLLELAKSTHKSIYGGKIKFIEGKDTKYNIIKYIQKKSQPSKRRNLSFYDNVMHNTLSGGCSFILREHANQIFPIPENLKFEDWWASYHLIKNGWVEAYTDIVTIYRVHDDNDAISLDNKYESMKRDYLRHFEYLEEFKKVASSIKEFEAIQKSLAIRQAFFKDYRLSHFRHLSFDKYSLMILSFYFPGSKVVCNIKDYIDLLKFYKSKCLK